MPKSRTPVLVPLLFIRPLMRSRSYAFLCIHFVAYASTHAYNFMYSLFGRFLSYASMKLCALMQRAISYAVFCYAYELLSYLCDINFILCMLMQLSSYGMRSLRYAYYVVFMHSSGVLFGMRIYVLFRLMLNYAAKVIMRSPRYACYM